MDLNDFQTFQSWELLAAVLPAVIAFLIMMYHRATGKYADETVRRTVAVAVYVVYGLVGSAIEGEFDALTWDTAEDVLSSIVKVAMAGYASYKTFAMLALNKTEGEQRVEDREAGERV